MKAYELEELVLSDILREKAELHPSRTFLKLRDGEATYGEIDERVERLACGFAARQVRVGDHVAVMLPNSADSLCVIFALARLGAVVVPVNTATKGSCCGTSSPPRTPPCWSWTRPSWMRRSR